MIPPQFAYFAPTTLHEALALLHRYGSEAKLLSGGQSLIPLMKLRLATPAYLIDLNRMPGLDHLQERNGFLRIGALTREADLEGAELVRTKYPIVYETARVIGDPLVRNLATIGGNLAHADPANDHPATMLALEAEIVATGPDGERTIPASEFFTDFFTTALRPEEILTAIRIPAPAARSGGSVRQIGTQGRRLRHRWRGGARDSRATWHLHTRRPWSDQRWSHTAEGSSGRGLPPGQAPGPGQHQAGGATRGGGGHSQKPTCVARSSTSAIWCGC